jgi:hypothetical protein
MFEKLMPFLRRYWPVGLVTVGLLFWSAWASIQAHRITYEKPISETYEKSSRRACTEPGFYHHTKLVPDGDGGMSTRYVYGFHAACPGTRPVKLTVQDFWYERRNGKTGERTKVLASEDTGSCTKS